MKFVTHNCQTYFFAINLDSILGMMLKGSSQRHQNRVQVKTQNMPPNEDDGILHHHESHLHQAKHDEAQMSES